MKSIMITRVELGTKSHDRCLVDFALDYAGTIPARGFSLEKDEPLMIRLNDIEVDMNEFIKVYKENKLLRAKLGLAIEALKFYSDSDCYKKFGGDNLSEIEEDCGDVASEILEEINK